MMMNQDSGERELTCLNCASLGIPIASASSYVVSRDLLTIPARALENACLLDAES